MRKITVNQLNRILVGHQTFIDSGHCSGERANLAAVDLRAVGSTLTGINLAGALLSGANLSGLNLSKTNFRAAFLRETTFNGCTLWNADLRGADARGASFRRCDLAFADFRGASLEGADFVETTAWLGWETEVVDCTPFVTAEKKKEKETKMELSEEEMAVITKMREEKAVIARRALVMEVVGKVVAAAQGGRDFVCMPTSIDQKSFESVKRIMDMMGLCVQASSSDIRSFTFKVRKE